MVQKAALEFFGTNIGEAVQKFKVDVINMWSTGAPPVGENLVTSSPMPISLSKRKLNPLTQTLRLRVP